MIGNIGGGGGFGGLLGYVLDKEKQPRILSENMASDTPSDLAREFRRISNGNRRISKPVKHISVSFAPEDGVVEDWLKEAIALRLLNGLGYQETPYLVVAHDRDDPGHDAIHDHDHIHIITSAVDYDGNRVDPSWEAYRMQSILREAEIDFGLRQVASSWDVKREKALGLKLDSDLAHFVANSFKDRPNLKTWLDRLAQSDIDVRFNISKNDNVMGITYLKDGEVCKGSDLGASWTVVNDRVSFTADDLSLMKATNIKSQEQPVRLSKLDRAMFDRAVEMAVMKLGRDKKFKNSRADIKLDGDTLTVVRMRPHRLMLKATQTQDGKWEPVGFPHVEKRDVEQLERFNGVESKKFEAPHLDETLDAVDEFIYLDAYAVRDLDQEQDEYIEEEGLSL
jgi:Relaxase/Mobilisation nuclease domain